MSSIQETYWNAILSDATYAVKANSENVGGLALIQRLREDMTEPLATHIAANFTLVTHIESDSATGSGFDATVWRRNDGTLFVSMRGTDGQADFLADANLFLASNAGRQVVDMVNWWLRITTPTNQQAAQYAYTLDPLPSVAGQGRITAAEITAGVYVNGHSLGGYLAAAFTRLVGAQANVQHTTTFNSAGFGLGSEAAFAAIQAAIGANLGRPFPGPGDPSQSNVFAANGINVTTNSFWFSQMGRRVGVSIEEGSGVPNHSMYKLTDSLALAAAIEKLDTSMTLDRAGVLLQVGANQRAASLEGALDGLRRLLLGPQSVATLVGDAGGSQLSRVSFHSNLAALQASLAFQSLAGKVDLSPASAGLANTARNDFASLLALQTLSPLVLRAKPGNESVVETALANANNASYIAWLADKALSTADRDAGTATYSDQWIADRSAMLDWVATRNAKDLEGVINEATSGRAIPVPLNYQDFSSGTQLQLRSADNNNQRAQIIFGSASNEPISGFARDDRLYGGAGNDVLSGQGGNDYLEGNADNDTLNGGEGIDTLVGGTGADWLIGGAGIDRLQGGLDADYYSFETGWGIDTIEDMDGLGSIAVAGVGAINGAGTLKLAEGVWQSADKQVTYVLDESRSNLVITFRGRNDSIIVPKWTPQLSLGISLAATQSTPATTTTLSGFDGDDLIVGNCTYGGTVFPSKTTATPPAASGIELPLRDAGLWSRPGFAVDVPIESQWPPSEPDFADSFNLSQMILTDALAVHAWRAANEDRCEIERCA